MNFDAGRVGENVHGWGFVIRNHVGDVVLMGAKQGLGFSTPEEEEARACFYALSTALNHGFSQLVVEGDCQALISKLQRGVTPNNSLGFFISDILSLLVRLEFISWSFVKRGGNTVARAIAHLPPVALQERLWTEEGPDIVYDLATKDMCTYIDQALI